MVIKKRLKGAVKIGGNKMKVTNFRNQGTESEQWFCPKCNKWTTPWHYSISNGRTETDCNYCGEMLETITVK